MGLDEALLESRPQLNQPALRFYGWSEPAASFGYFQPYAVAERLTALRPLVRRPTGGGLVPHDADWTYSAAFPPTHEWYSLSARESYRRIHLWIQAAFARMGIDTQVAPGPLKVTPGVCFGGYEQSDLLHQGRKIAGAAQRRRRDGLLIQGSVQPPPGPDRTDWEDAMRRVAIRLFDVDWIEYGPDDGLASRASTLALEKYAQSGYTRMR